MAVINTSSSTTSDTELSSAAALDDGTTNPTTSLVGACLEVFNGTTWDRLKGTSQDGVYVQGSWSHGANDSGNPVKVGGKATDPTSLPTAVDSGDRANLVTSLQGEVLVYLSRLLSGEDQTNSIFAVSGKPLANSTYSYSNYQNLGAAVTANIKASTGNVFSVSCHNENASDRYLQLHNTASTPSAGATPLFSLLVSTSNQIIIGTDFFGENGINFSSGIAFAFSTTKDTYTAGSAGDHSTWVQYI